MNDRGNQIATSDNTLGVTSDEWTQGVIISIAIGLYYMANGFWPLIAWQGWIKDKITAEISNLAY